jgi:transcriptional regulator with XRE-family HTH domain
MGRSTRPRPKHLALKLLRIRQALGLKQAEMVERLGRKGLYPGHVSEYERGEREPPYPTLLKYARLAGISTDVLIDDELDLPEHLPVPSGKQVDYVRPK